MSAFTDFFSQYKLVIIAFVVLCFIAVCFSTALRGKMKKFMIVSLVIVAVATGYYFATGKSVLSIPGAVIAFFGDPQIKDEPSHRYYREQDDTQLHQ